ncbi:neutral zinc metallopeptidase [Kribbella sp. NPDC051587]|uniref:neutral zinc metallopeptidase n=1 Tax=Kribbella sp. NPDC051587 TaxID=3364119 RepID=UPI003791493E
MALLLDKMSGAPPGGPLSNQYGQPPQQYGPPPGPPPQYGPPPQQYWGPPPGPPQYGPPMGPPPGGPGFGFGGNGYPPPKKKRSKAPFIVVPAVLLFAGVVSLYLFALHAKQERNNYSSPSPTYTSSYSPSEDPSYYPSSTRPTVTQPTVARPTQPRPTKTTPPPPSDLDVTARNKFYKTGVQKSVNCRAPSIAPTSEANARKYYAAVIACLNKAWPAQIRKAGVQWEGVKMTTYWYTGYSPCGSNTLRSFYCSSNNTIYMDAKSDVDAWKKYTNFAQGRNWVRAGMMDTPAHEYGHHLQDITGILDANYRLKYQKSGDKALEQNRRMEIQATCFGHVFLGANRKTMISSGVRKELDYINHNSGDEYDTKRDHGSKAIQPYWADRGYNTRNPAYCNTFTAGPQYVR